jgi:hypothetical protein
VNSGTSIVWRVYEFQFLPWTNKQETYNLRRRLANLERPGFENVLSYLLTLLFPIKAMYFLLPPMNIYHFNSSTLRLTKIKCIMLYQGHRTLLGTFDRRNKEFRAKKETYACSQ